MVEADDNILPVLVTEVRGDVLVLTTEPNTSISTTRGIRYTITAASRLRCPRFLRHLSSQIGYLTRPYVLISRQKQRMLFYQ